LNGEGSLENLITKFLVSSENVIYRNCENENHREGLEKLDLILYGIDGLMD